MAKVKFERESFISNEIFPIHCAAHLMNHTVRSHGQNKVVWETDAKLLNAVYVFGD